MKIKPDDLEWWATHELLVGAILPRPIAWVSTIGADGVNNLAPFSFMTVICLKPSYIGISISNKRDGQRKDTVNNIEFSGDFVVNVVTEELAQPMNQSSRDYPSHVDEFKEAGLTPLPCDFVKSPRVAESPVNLECQLVKILEFGEPSRLTQFIIGEIVQVHIKDGVWVQDAIQAHTLKAIGRMGGDLYSRTVDTFEMKRPKS